MVDVDEAEIRKMKTTVHLPVVADAGAFLRELNRQLGESDAAVTMRTGCSAARTGSGAIRSFSPSTASCGRASAPTASRRQSPTSSRDGDIVASGSSGAGVELFLLAFQVKESQRVLHSRGLGAMGFGLPASIGACLGAGGGGRSASMATAASR